MDKTLRRNFIVGSEWLYYKIYTGHKTADLILTEVIKPVSMNLLKKGLIDKWFFIRYADPKHHLRVRFKSTKNEYLGPIISELYKTLNEFKEQDLIWKVQLDTYQREVERYGVSTMELSEDLFFSDSIAVVLFLGLIEGDEGEQLRWLYGLRAIDVFLDTFEFGLEEKLGLMDRLKTGFGQEFGMSRPLKRQLDDKFRKERTNIENFLSFKENEEPDYAPMLTILGENQKRMHPIAKQIKKMVNENKAFQNLDNLMGSYIHMLMNRLFKSKNRLNEMVCYDFLYRHYRTAIAIQKKHS